MATVTFKKVKGCNGGDHVTLQVSGAIDATRLITIAEVREREVNIEQFLMDALALHALGKSNATLNAEFTSQNGWVLTI